MRSLFRPRKRVQEIQLAHVLRAVPLFADLPADDLVAIWRRLIEVRVPAGAVLFERGDPGDRFYVIQSGTVQVRLGLDDTGVVLRQLVSGDVVGEMALLTGDPRSADVVVQEDAVLWALDLGDFNNLLSESIPLLRALNRALCDLVRKVTQRLEESETGWGSVSGMRVGPYRVVTQIGAGGMAVVYSATRASDDELVAIKVLPGGWGGASDFRERLVREASALQLLSHPNVVKILDTGEVDERLGGGRYLVMEWLPGALDRVLRSRYPEPLPVAQALAIAHGVAQGLAAVHAVGMIHRDVKPSNILLRADETPVLTDFGLVGRLPGEADQQRLTASNVIVGTADYMAPEQVAGLPLDGRADLYALGVVLFEMLAGTVPFAGRDPIDTLRAQVEEACPPLPTDIPPGVRDLVDRALRKRPADRFPSAGAMAGALQEVAGADMRNLG